MNQPTDTIERRCAFYTLERLLRQRNFYLEEAARLNSEGADLFEPRVMGEDLKLFNTDSDCNPYIDADELLAANMADDLIEKATRIGKMHTKLKSQVVQQISADKGCASNTTC